jgi:phosphoglycerate dehydrogenase-like enzyme
VSPLPGSTAKIALGPLPLPAWAAGAVLEAGAQIVDIADANGLVWLSHGNPGELFDVLAGAPNVSWVHLRWAGIEEFAKRGALDDGRIWTCGKGVFAEAVAEHALALGLAGLRGLPHYVSAKAWREGTSLSLFDGNVTVLGGGSITQALWRLLAPLRVRLTVVRRTSVPFDGASRTLTPDRLADALPGADLVVVALPLTTATVGIVGAPELRRMESHAWLVNVARGAHVVTDDLVTALREDWIGGAALDVTDPEPLPSGHPLWALERCVITPHAASPTAMTVPAIRSRIVENVRRLAAHQPLVGTINTDAGY